MILGSHASTISSHCGWRTSTAVALLLAVTLKAHGMEPPTARPIALAGASYGLHEVRSMIRNVLTVSAERQCRYEALGALVPTADLDR